MASGTLLAIHNSCLLNGVSFSSLACGKARGYGLSTCQITRSHRRKDLTRVIVCLWEKPGRSLSRVYRIGGEEGRGSSLVPQVPLGRAGWVKSLAAGNSGKEPQCPRGLAKANQAVLALPPCARGWRGGGCLARGNGRNRVADLCFHLISSVVFQTW